MVAYDDPLIAALQAGHKAVVVFNGRRTEYGLKGSKRALEIFKAHCGWTPQGFKQNLARNAGSVPLAPRSSPDGSVPLQPQAKTKADGSGQPSDASGARPVYGVAPGEVHTPPNQRGELWFTASRSADAVRSRALTYGIPETDAVAAVATCRPETNEDVQLRLFPAAPQPAEDNQPVAVHVSFDGTSTILRGKMDAAPGHSPYVDLRLAADDDFWSELQTAKSVEFAIEGMPTVTVPGAANAAALFIQQCSRPGSGR